MLRLAAILTAIIIAIAAAALFSNAALAQSPDPTLPVAGPDEIIFVGEVPAPPGTEIRAEYLFNEPVVCGTSRADENSEFVIRIDAECARGGTGPLICWAPGLEACQGFPSSPLPGADRPEGGDTIDLGRVAVPEARPPRIGPAPHGDGVADIALPETGTGLAFDDEGSTFRWQLWIGAVMLGAASMTAVLAYLIRVKRLR